MRFDVVFRRFRCMVRGVHVMSMRQVGMVRRFLVVSCLVMLCCFAVVACCVVMMLRSKMMMFAGLL